MMQLKKMGFVRCGVFHIPTKPESLENAGRGGESIQALVRSSVQVRSGIWAWISWKVRSDANQGLQVGSEPTPATREGPHRKDNFSTSKGDFGEAFL